MQISLDILKSVLHIPDLLSLDVQFFPQVPLHDTHYFVSGLGLSLLFLHYNLAEINQNLVEILQCDHDTRPRCQRLHFGGTISRPCEKLLNRKDFIREVDIRIWVNLVKQCRRELLERMYVVLNLRDLYHEAPSKCQGL